MGLMFATGLFMIGGWLGDQLAFDRKPMGEIFRAVKAKQVPPYNRMQVVALIVAIVSLLFITTIAHAAAPQPVLGRTPAEVHALFPIIIDQHMRTNGNFHVHNLGALELANLAALYQHANGTTAPLLRILAQNADSEGLTRVASAFGQQATAAAVAKYSSPAVALAFTSSPPKPTVVAPIMKALPSMSPMRWISQKPRLIKAGFMLVGAPTPDMSLYEIYLEYRTSPVGSLSVGSSLVETSTYAGNQLIWAAGVGYTVGTGINMLLDDYFPDTAISLGNLIGGFVDSLTNPSNTSSTNGQIESDINGAIQSTGIGGVPDNSTGDYGIMSDMYQTYSCGGNNCTIHPHN